VKKKLHNEELNDLYSYIQYFSGDKIENNEIKRPLVRPRRRWENNIKMDLQEVGCEVWIGSSWLRIGKGGGLF
jgi:hypothetical protein